MRLGPDDMVPVVLPNSRDEGIPATTGLAVTFHALPIGRGLGWWAEGRGKDVYEVLG